MTATATAAPVTPFGFLHPTGQDILHHLHYNGTCTASEIASEIGYPDASVRRWIGTLRDHGYDIQTTGFGYSFRF